MEQYKKRFQLKNLAKDRLLGKYPDSILLLITSGAVQAGAYMAAMVLIPSEGIFGTIMGLAVVLLLSILLNVLRIGTALFYLNIACNQPFSISNLFYGYREQANKCLAISGLICGLSFLFGLPGQVCSLLFTFTADSRWMLLSYGLDLVFQALLLPLSLALSQSYYLVLDYPELPAMDTLKMSFRIMKGHKARLFLLQLSFLPLVIASCFTFAIGFLWLIPYMQMTYALFFLDLMSPKREAAA